MTDEQLKAGAEQLRQVYANAAEGLYATDIEPSLAAQGEVLTRYQKLFSRDALPYLEADAFKSFLRFDNNLHWSDLHRQGPNLTADMDALRQALLVLVDDSRPIEDRYDEAVSSVRGMGKAIATAILVVMFPNKFGVWNSVSHPAYGYEDFLEGYRPTEINGSMHFVLRDGIFKQLCAQAKAQPEHNFYLIVDEINRGDIPRIFGELLTLLEKNKRGKTAILPLSGEPFTVPENLYVIGTMNTADRSIALLDAALRRRFGFLELLPEVGVLADAFVRGLPHAAWLRELNSRIIKNVGRDARNLQIGHAYLLDKGQPVTEFAHFARIVREDIIPLLEEYCYEDYDRLEHILGTGLVDVNAQQIRVGLFTVGSEDDLIRALLEPTPELATAAPTNGSSIDDAGEDAEDQEVAEDEA